MLEYNEMKVIGWQEYLALPTLGVDRINVKVDTGAETSCLHAENISEFMKGDKKFVKFSIPMNIGQSRHVECEVVDQRIVKSSNGESEKRYVIFSMAKLFDVEWGIEITLSDRSLMKFNMLLGRSALKKRFIVDPSATFTGCVFEDGQK